ncbi:MAG: cation-translocating P-type ATPase [Candidatus Promineifilaceae bacterium]|nr:cation-translocating P-type ATPase [Candidatus Promineifilaceae bacterium]
MPDEAQNWTTQDVATVLRYLGSDPETGLDSSEARSRLQRYGPNELQEQGGRGPLLMLGEQFSSTMVLILIGAAVISAFLGKPTETVAITAIVLLFALLGFVQEYRAERAMAALKQLAVPVVRVRRDGSVREISARELVPGDIVYLETGNLVPADLRLIESVNLRIQEAALTGESEPVDKETAALQKADLPLAERRNMAYMGTVVTYGRGTAVVVATGMETELGRIAELLQAVAPEATPLQRRLDQVGKALAVLGAVVAVLVLVIGVLRGEPLNDMFLTAVSVAVAVVPEGLPAVVTVTLALGAQRMLARNALIRKLPAVETLGSVTIIASDKTGTLTINRMTVTVIDVAGHTLELTGTAQRPPSGLARPVEEPLVEQPPTIALVLAVGALANDASLQPDPESGRYLPVGDPTEGALLVASRQAGIGPDALRAALPRVGEAPFDSERKRMTTVHRLPEPLPSSLQPLQNVATPFVAFTKGAVDGLLQISTHVWEDGRAVPLTDAWRERIERANEQLAANGMRVLGMAFRAVPVEKAEEPAEALEQALTFAGLVGMIDPPRPEVKEAVATCKRAGIRPLMITGDHPLTARFIADDLGIATNGRVKTGQDLDRLSPVELAQVVGEVSIYARVAPEHKLRLVEDLRAQGHVVAMTGDGVNDAPALKRADIGVAMGITGTDVSKEAADMVLVDDNFATIVSAIEEGRVIYDNIRRFVKFSIAGNVGKVLVMLLAPVLVGANVALLPLQLLWLNLLTDGLLGLGLGMEPAERETMQRPPRSPQAGLFDGGLRRHIAWVGVLIGFAALAVGRAYYEPGDVEGGTWQTMIFTALAFMQIGQALASRSTESSLLSIGLRSNRPMLFLVLITIILQLLVIYVPFLDAFFNITPLALQDLGVAAFLGLVVLAAIEVEKWLLRRRPQGERRG